MDIKKEGHFIVIDGCDGAGKTTQIERLKTTLPGLYGGREFVFTREPGGSPFAEKIRNLILSPDAKKASGPVLAQLFGAARLEHLAKTVLPQMKRGKIVISDRFDGSTYAYQIVAQEGGRQVQQFFQQQRQIIRSYYLTNGWHTILLDLDVELSLERMKRRAGEATHFDEREKAFHAKVREGFGEYARQYPRNLSIIDASKSADEMHLDILQAIRQVLR